MTRYAAIIGEAIIDLVAHGGEESFRPHPGGSPLNVAVGVSRLGDRVEFVTSFGSDVFATQLEAALAEERVSTLYSVSRPALTSLAVTTFAGAEPSFSFYGSPPSYGQIGPGDIDVEILADAGVIHAGSIALLEEPTFRLASSAFELSDPVKTIDPNVRPSLIDDFDQYRTNLESLFALADIVKLSDADAQHLYQLDAEQALAKLAGLGALLVVVTCGRDGVVAMDEGRLLRVEAPTVDAVDTTGAGDAFMAALITRALAGRLSGTEELKASLAFAARVAAAACCAQGGSTAMPKLDEVEVRLSASQQVVDA